MSLWQAGDARSAFAAQRDHIRTLIDAGFGTMCDGVLADLLDDMARLANPRDARRCAWCKKEFVPGHYLRVCSQRCHFRLDILMRLVHAA